MKPKTPRMEEHGLVVSDAAFDKFLDANHYVYGKQFGDGRCLFVQRLLTGTAGLQTGNIDSPDRQF